jgi:hypothetical protein
MPVVVSLGHEIHGHRGPARADDASISDDADDPVLGDGRVAVIRVLE